MLLSQIFGFLDSLHESVLLLQLFDLKSLKLLLLKIFILFLFFLFNQLALLLLLHLLVQFFFHQDLPYPCLLFLPLDLLLMQLCIISQNLSPLVLVLTLLLRQLLCILKVSLGLVLTDSLLDKVSLTLPPSNDCKSRLLHGLRPLHALGHVQLHPDLLLQLFERMFCELMVALGILDEALNLSLHHRVHLGEMQVPMNPLGEQVLDLGSRLSVPAWRGAEPGLGVVLS